MEKIKINSIIKTEAYNTNFEFDKVGMTWGISYIRFTIGLKKNFNCLEQFFISAFKTENNLSSMMEGGKTWEERANFANWANGLKIEEIDTNQIKEFTKESIKDLDEFKNDWDINQRIDTSTLKLPKLIKKGWLIKETVDVRHFINTTVFYLANCGDTYLLIEGHWES